MTWLQTVGGIRVDLRNPDPSTILISDIAYALANLNRYTGHTTLSVAQHSVMCAEAAPPGLEFEALMHDAHEAYTGDMSSPVKRTMREIFREQNGGGLADPFRRVERTMRRVVAQVFGLEPDIPEPVEEIDLRMCQTERLQLFDHQLHWPAMEGTEPYDIEICPWSPTAAEWRFLETFNRLRWVA